jgi:hypothetical protein
MSLIFPLNYWMPVRASWMNLYYFRTGACDVSEPEDFLKLSERMDSWALMVALIGEGQEIHPGEESGLPGYMFVNINSYISSPAAK